MKKVLLTTVLLLIFLPAFAFAQTQTVTMTCIGDTLIGSNDLVSVEDYAFQRYIEQFGYAYPFAKLQSLLANDDITLANFECVLNDDAPRAEKPLLLSRADRLCEYFDPGQRPKSSTWPTTTPAIMARRALTRPFRRWRVPISSTAAR